MKKVSFVLAAAAMMLAACQPEEEKIPVVDVTMSSFGFYAETNPEALKADFVVSNPSSQISIVLPYGTPEDALTSLVPSFEVTEGATVTVEETEVESGVTALDFSVPVELLVTVNAKSNAQYTVTVSVAGPASWSKKAVSEATFKSEPALALSPVSDDLYAFGYLQTREYFPLMLKYSEGSIVPAADTLAKVGASYIAANCSSDGTPYAVFYNKTNKNMKVFCIASGVPVEVGDASELLANTGSSVGSNAIVPISSNDVWVFLMNNKANTTIGTVKRGLNVCHFNGSTWSQNVEMPGWNAKDATFIMQTKWVAGVPYIFILDFTTAKFFVYKYEKSNWVAVCDGIQPLRDDNSTPISSAEYKYGAMNFDVDSNGDVYILAAANYESASEDNIIGMLKYDIEEKTCSLVGGLIRNVTASKCRYLSMALDNNDVPYVVYGNTFIDGGSASVTYIDAKTKTWAEPVALTADKASGIDIRFSESGLGYIVFNNDSTGSFEVWTNE